MGKKDLRGSTPWVFGVLLAGKPREGVSQESYLTGNQALIGVNIFVSRHKYLKRFGTSFKSEGVFRVVLLSEVFWREESKFSKGGLDHEGEGTGQGIDLQISLRGYCRTDEWRGWVGMGRRPELGLTLPRSQACGDVLLFLNVRTLAFFGVFQKEEPEGRKRF